MPPSSQPFKLLPTRSPLVSIIVPTYNREKYLPAALDTVLSQSFSDFECIVINDGSSDNTQEIIEKKLAEDERIISIHQINRGEYPTTNLGLRAAQGKYITWIHSDDLWPADTLAKRVATLENHSESDFTHGDIDKIDPEGNVIKTIPAEDWPAERMLADFFLPHSERTHEYPVHHLSVMFRREFLTKTGYWDESLPYAGDLDWLIRAIKTGKAVKTPGLLYHYRQHPTSRMETDKKKINTTAVVEFILNRYRS